VRRLPRVLAVLTVLAAAFAGRASAQPPNILIVLTDDQRAADTMWVMPKTTRYFERQGVDYPNAFSVTPLCCPSRATIFTGRYAHNTGVKSNGPPHAFDTTTVVTRLLQGAGYQTGLVGKFLNSWPLSDPPPYFDRYALGGSPYEDPRFNVDGSLRAIPGYSTRIEQRFSLRFLHRFEENDRAPWFLYIGTHAPHHPWQPEPKYAHVKLPQWAGNPAVFEKDLSDKPPFVQAAHRFGIDDGRKVRKHQLRTLMSVDDMVGKVFTTLGKLHERGRTIAFFLTDNGYLWADHHLGGDRQSGGQKRLPYTASVRIPFFVRWPDHLPAGTSDPRLTGTLDIVPTILEAAGIAPDPAGPPLDGRSLLQPDVRDHMLFEYWHGRNSGWIPSWASLRGRGYQYIEYYDTDNSTITFREYYDMAADRWQLDNLLADASPGNDPHVAALSAQLAADRTCVGTGPGPGACP
jgi:arylsulfatase A-like enzyme